jgi:hypothetical protein
MKRVRWIAPLTALLVAALAGTAAEKGTVVDIDGFKATAPAEWKEETPGPLRFMQFKLPKVKDDKLDGEVVIFKDLRDTVEGNIKRWKDDFKPPEGKKIDDVTKVEEVKVGDTKMTYVQIEGTFLYKMRPRDPSEKPQPRPDHKRLGLVFEVKGSPIQVRLTGPAATVDHYKKGFEEWFKSFK